MTNKTYVSVENYENQELNREILVEPFTNYNLLVIDQTFNKNSSITFTNSNVNRFEKNFRKSNVSSLMLNLVDKKNKYQLGTKINISQIKTEPEKEIGFSSSLSFKKIQGNFRFNFSNSIESDKYDHNDMGFLYDNNEINNCIMGYYILNLLI